MAAAPASEVQQDTAVSGALADVLLSWDSSIMAVDEATKDKYKENSNAP